MESLNSMQCFLSSRPKQFSTPQQAIEYMVRSGQVRNVESARVSIMGQIRPMVTETSSHSADASAISSSTLASVSHSCDTVREEDEDEAETTADRVSNDLAPPIATISAAEGSNYTWRIDLSSTEQFWKGWFSGEQKPCLGRRRASRFLRSIKRVSLLRLPQITFTGRCRSARS